MSVKKILISVIAGAILFGFSGCSQKGPSYRLGQFTVASSHNIRNLYYSEVEGSSLQTSGEDCHVVGDKPNDSRLQRAMDNAIRNGQKNGIDGDMLANVRIDQSIKEKNTGVFGIGVSYNCMIVTGDLVKIIKKNVTR
jgi:hypothetical protein